MVVGPFLPLRPLLLEAAGNLEEIRGVAHIANLPAHSVQRMAHAALVELRLFRQPRSIKPYWVEVQPSARVGRLCWPHRCSTPFWVPRLLRREACPPRIGSEAGRRLRKEVLSGATLDIHAANQVLIYLALAGGSSRFLARNLSSHAATTIWLLEQFLPVRFSVSPADHLVRIKMEPNMTHTRWHACSQVPFLFCLRHNFAIRERPSSARFCRSRWSVPDTIDPAQ